VEALLGGNRWGSVERVTLAAQSPATVAVSCNGYSGAPFAPMLFPIGAAPSEIGKVLGLYCKESLKASKIIILKETDAIVPGLIAKSFAEHHSGVTEQTIHANEAPDSLKDLKADAFLLCASARNALAWKAKLPAGVPLLFGGEEAELAILQREAEAKRDFIAVASFHPDDATATSSAFVARYRERYGKAPSTSAALSYDAVMIWSEAARRASATASDKVREQLAKKQATFAVLTGTLWFEADQTPRRPLFVIRIASAAVKLEKRFEP
jgi:ABC-type branched-subunit amino acid transport system substrate-binding protein